MSGSSMAVSLAAVGHRAQSPFTAAQWQELEHQALIFKYLKAGLLVPPELLAPIRKSFESISARFLGYCSYYGKKIDPEPGRCRRTDGKKWRCSKDAYPDSKYCERHMNKGRYRSRKPVESQSTSQSLSTVALDIATGSRSGSGSFQNLPLQSVGNCEGLYFESNVSGLQMEPITYGISNKEYRCLQGLKPATDEHDILPAVTSASINCLGINSAADSAWRLVAPQIPSNPLQDPRNGALLQRNCPQLHMPQDFEPLTIDADISKRQHFFGREFGSPRSVKQDYHSLQPHSDKWSRSRDLGSSLDDQRANKNSLFTTQLSMSIPAHESFASSAHDA